MDNLFKLTFIQFSSVQFTISEVSLFLLGLFPSGRFFFIFLRFSLAKTRPASLCRTVLHEQYCIKTALYQLISATIWGFPSQGQSRGCKVLYLGGGRGRVYIAANSWHSESPSDTLLLMIAWRDDRKREKGVDDLVRIYIWSSELAGKNFIVKKSVGWDSALYNQV